MNGTTLTYLALGDSYTIGEAVPLHGSFPYQLVSLLREQRISIAAPEIVARTGWTTDELTNAISSHRFLPKYDLVTLLIGVNNQYRGRLLEEYTSDFRRILNQAIRFAEGKQNHVIVLSIPDYGVTPFAKDRNPQKIAQEIDAFNAAASKISKELGVTFLDITTGSRAALEDGSLVAPDGLHPSEKEYRKWAEKTANRVVSQLQKGD